MTDVKMRRNGTKIFIEAKTVYGATVLLENYVIRPEVVQLIVEYEHAQDLENALKAMGLEVEGP